MTVVDVVVVFIDVDLTWNPNVLIFDAAEMLMFSTNFPKIEQPTEFSFWKRRRIKLRSAMFIGFKLLLVCVCPQFEQHDSLHEIWNSVEDFL